MENEIRIASDAAKARSSEHNHSEHHHHDKLLMDLSDSDDDDYLLMDKHRYLSVFQLPSFKQMKAEFLKGREERRRLRRRLRRHKKSHRDSVKWAQSGEKESVIRKAQSTDLVMG